MVALVSRAGAVRQEQALVPAVVGVAHRRVDADVGRDARQGDVLDAFAAEEQIQIGGVEGSFPGLIDDGFAFKRSQLWNNFPSRFSTNEDPPARPRVANSGSDTLTTPSLVPWKIRQIRTMAFARVHDEETFPSGLAKHALNRCDWRARKGNVVAHLVDISACATEIDLHVDD